MFFQKLGFFDEFFLLKCVCSSIEVKQMLSMKIGKKIIKKLKNLKKIAYFENSLKMAFLQQF
jgi:hypothetical protein